MKEIETPNSCGTLIALLVAFCWPSSLLLAERPGWERREVNWRMGAGRSITAIHYPKAKAPPAGQRAAARPAKSQPSSDMLGAPTWGLATYADSSDAGMPSNIVNSPPIAGFVAWIAVGITDERGDEMEFDAVPATSVVGGYLTGSPQTDYAIGIFDTGAGAHIIGAADAEKVGLYSHSPSMITSSYIDVSGVTGTVSARVSQPVGIFIDGLSAIESDTLLLDDSYMVGQTNVSAAVGDPIDSALLPTVVGSPLSVYFAAAILNDSPVTVVRDGNEFTGPDLLFYDSYDPAIPDYPGSIQLQLRPTGGAAVQYFPNFFVDIDDPDWGAPFSPSVISSFIPTQSLFFVSSVDLTHRGRSAIDKSGFMFDTGAQVTVVSRAIAARLSLNPADPNFLVEIRDVTGEMTMEPAFYLEKLEMAASPQWLTLTNVPVVMLDVPSPEGGTLEGIIGMNLFTEFNLVLRGGGLPDYGGHELLFERLPARLTSDIWPASGDGMVNLRDLAAFAGAWLTTVNSQYWLPGADMSPQPDGDKIINFFDFAVFAQQWLAESIP